MASESATAESFVAAVLERCAGFRSVQFFAVLDHASKDDTADRLRALARRDPRLRVVWAPENRCVADAYLRGYRGALAAGCDWVLEIDAGFSHQPADVPQFFDRMLEGYDCVFGSRFCPGGRISESPLRRTLISYGGTLVTNLLLGTRLKDMTSGFELFSRDALRHALDKGIHSRGPFFQTEIKVHCRSLRVTEVPIHYRAASHRVGRQALTDALANLWRLFQHRLSGSL